jgi:hypothetical protein
LYLFIIVRNDSNNQKSLEMDELVTHFAYELMTEKEKELEEAEMKRKVEEDKKLNLELKIDKIEIQMKDILENSRKIYQYKN